MTRILGESHRLGRRQFDLHRLDRGLQRDHQSLHPRPECQRCVGVGGHSYDSGHLYGDSLLHHNNGDFENGPDGSWLITSSNSLEDFVIVDLSDYDISNHSGIYAAWLGGDPAEVTTITQHLTVPGDATLLDYWYWIDSNDSCGKSQGTVYLDSTLLKTYDLCQVTSGWTNEQLAIPAEFRGKTSDLIFKAETAPDPAQTFFSSFLLDDVSILGALSPVSLKSPGQTPKTRLPFSPGLRKSARPSAEKRH